MGAGPPSLGAPPRPPPSPRLGDDSRFLTVRLIFLASVQTTQERMLVGSSRRGPACSRRKRALPSWYLSGFTRRRSPIIARFPQAPLPMAAIGLTDSSAGKTSPL